MRSWVRPVAFCLLIVHVFFSLGISVPMPKLKGTAERFPCENRPCGCSSAAHCWDTCCCHTDEEKLSWADRNGVKPPDFLVERVATSPSRVKRQRASSSPQQSCCQQPTPNQQIATRQCGGCCSKKKASSDIKCCSKDSENVRRTENRQGQVTDSGFAFQVVLFDPSLRCKGIELALMLFGDTWIPQKSNSAEPPSPVCIEWLFPIDVRRVVLALDVESPIPRARRALS